MVLKSFLKDKNLSVGIYTLGAILGVFVLFSSLVLYETDRRTKVQAILDDNTIVKTDVFGQVKEIIVNYNNLPYGVEYKEPQVIRYTLHKSQLKGAPEGYTLVIDKVLD